MPRIAPNFDNKHGNLWLNRSRIENKNLCLVVARKFYPNPTKPDRVSPDDRINKPSTRQALAMAGSCVQFLLHWRKQKKMASLKLEDFFHRAQSALKDLLFCSLRSC